jgi:alkylhydroperoxidase/carboxymuconolactone decarboxylase family protein YurZ
MDDQKRRDDGMAQRSKVPRQRVGRQVDGQPECLQCRVHRSDDPPRWDEIWTRPHFDDRTRRVLVIGTMVALGQWDEFRLHVRAALAEGGFTPDDIKEI